MNSKTGYKTYLLLVLSMSLWGGTWVAGRVVSENLSPWVAAFLRFALASAGLIAMHFLTNTKKPFLPPKRHIFPIMLLGATGIFGYSSFFFKGLQTTTSSRASLIVACIPVCVALASSIISRERLKALTIAGILMSLMGVAVVISDGNPASVFSEGVKTGDLMIIGCVICWTCYTLIGKPIMKQLPPLSVVTWSCIFGTVMLLPFAISSGLYDNITKARSIDWISLIFLGILATSLAYYWYYKAISEIGVVRSAIFINLVPLFAVIFGCILLKENLPISLLTGGSMVITGVTITIINRTK